MNKKRLMNAVRGSSPDGVFLLDATAYNFPAAVSGGAWLAQRRDGKVGLSRPALLATMFPGPDGAHGQ